MSENTQTHQEKDNAESGMEDPLEPGKSLVPIDEVDGKGHVSIASNDKAAIDDAVARIKKITFTPEVGGVYTGTVKTIMRCG